MYSYYVCIIDVQLVRLASIMYSSYSEHRSMYSYYVCIIDVQLVRLAPIMSLLAALMYSDFRPSVLPSLAVGSTP